MAERLGGEFFWDVANWTGSMRLSLDGTEVEAHALFSGQLPCTRLVAPALGAQLIELRVHHGYVYPIGRALGFQDVRVGDPDFDDRFIIKCNDDELARAWLDDAARAAVSAASDAYAFSVHDSVVLATRSGAHPEEDPAALEHALRATAVLARAGQRLLERWRLVAAQLGGRLSTREGRWGTGDEMVLELSQPNASIRVDVVFERLAQRGERSLWTRARTRRSAAVQDRWAVHPRSRKYRPTPRMEEGEPVSDAAFARRFRCLADDLPRLAARLTPARRVLLKDLSPAAIAGEPGEVIAWLPGFVHDPARLSRLADLVAELALEVDGTPSGPYR
jgi:hypothetical protein